MAKEDYTFTQLFARSSRTCEGNRDVNCFSVQSGCTTDFKNDLTFCNATSGWSPSIPFIVTGIDFLGGLRCTGDCLWGDNTTPPAVLWQLDGAPINSIGQGSINGSYFPGLSTSELLETLTATLIRVRDLAGGDAGLHTLTISSSTQPVEQDIRATLQIIARYVIVYTGAGTLIGPNDSVWIPARHAWFRYERSWFDVERPCEGLRQSPRVGSSAATNFVGDADQFMSVSFEQINMVFHVDGVVYGSLQLEHDGWHDVNATVNKLSADAKYALHGLWYHPNANVTRMGDVYDFEQVSDPPSATATSDLSPSSPSDVDNGVAEVESSKTSSTAAIAGGVAGGVAVLIVAALFIFFAIRKRRRNRTQQTDVVIGSYSGGIAPATGSPLFSSQLEVSRLGGLFFLSSCTPAYHDGAKTCRAVCPA
ncbi:hypothetical protein BDV98DRAFT_576103 [Pterulicium gracile]|uniref:Transmembrane protein n=1 Tax=Pterulicium gracile TaxID=1884261 RepID=A0A5C3Q2Y7_9AGAR|nr:hypothetical protein BDV98DRAFT_576103 [Pterula gracilis]